MLLLTAPAAPGAGVGTAAPTHLQAGGLSLPQTMDAATGLHHFPGHPWCLPLFLTDAICFAFPFPESSCGCQSNVPGLSEFGVVSSPYSLGST